MSWFSVHWPWIIAIMFWLALSAAVFIIDMKEGGPEEDSVFDNCFYYFVCVPIIIIFQFIADVYYKIRRKIQ